MTARSRKAADKPAVSVSVIVAAVAVLILILGGLAWHFFGSGTGGAPTRPLTNTEQADRDWVQQKAKQTKGRLETLSPEDQRRVMALYGPNAAFRFLMAARH
jgi:hypothetical protein